MKAKTIVRRTAKLALWMVIIALLLFALQLTALAYPQLIFSDHSVQHGTVTIYYDGGENTEMNSLAVEVDRRLSGCRFYDSTRSDMVYLFHDQSRYNLFTRLAMVTSDAQGFALSIFDNAYVCLPLVKAKSNDGGGHTKYSVWEGSLAHTIAHEIGHLYTADLIGRGRWAKLPHWKQEGFPEYIANIGEMQQDSLESLPARIDKLSNDRLWGGYRRWDHLHYEAGILVEYLLEIQSYSVEDIVADSVTREGALVSMRVWHEAGQ